MEKIKIISIGKIKEEILEYLKEKLMEKFGMKVEIGEFLENPDYAYNPKRKQYSSEAILKNIISRKIADEVILGIVDVDLYTLGIVDVDLYTPGLKSTLIGGLKSIFGIAAPLAKVAIVSLTRLREEFYRLPKNKNLFKERVLKASIHELGHIFGLGHCLNPKCVMYFCNTLADIDQKNSSFCFNCQNFLSKNERRKNNRDSIGAMFRAIMAL